MGCVLTSDLPREIERRSEINTNGEIQSEDGGIIFLQPSLYFSSITLKISCGSLGGRVTSRRTLLSLLTYASSLFPFPFDIYMLVSLAKLGRGAICHVKMLSLCIGVVLVYPRGDVKWGPKAELKNFGF